MKRLFLLAACLLFAACSSSGSSAPASSAAPTQSVPAPTVPPNPSANLGSELLADSGLEGSYVGGLNVDWHYDGSVGPARSTSPHSGSYAQEVQLSVDNGTPTNAHAYFWTGAAVSVGQWYRASFWAKRVAGTAADVYQWLYAPGSGVNATCQSVTDSAYTQYVCTAQATATSLEVGIGNYPSTDPSDTVVIDDASIRAIPFTSMVSLRGEASQYGNASANLTIQPGTQAGLVFCADSASNPQNYLIAYHDGVSIHFCKVINGSYTSIPAGGDIAYYNVSTNPAIAYVPGAALEIHRAPGSNTFSIYYNGRYVWQQTVGDQTIVNNTVHGAFNSFEGNQLDYSYSAVTSKKNVVFLGGSITNGTGASQGKYAWQWLYRDYLDTSYPTVSWSYTNASAGGTDSWYSLVRLQTDALALAPDIIFVDEAVNDGELAPGNPAWPYVGEAIIRRIRTALPNCKIVVCNFMRPAGSDTTPDYNTETVRAAWNEIAAYYHCDLYRMDAALLAALPANPTTAQIDTYFSSPGGVHPNDKGHALIFSGLSGSINLLAESVAWTGDLSSYPCLGPDTPNYEFDPAILSGTRLLAGNVSGGSWSNPGNADCSGPGIPSSCCTGSGTGTCSGAKSSAAGSTLSYTGPMVMVGLDIAMQSGAWPGGLQYSLDGAGWTTLTAQNPYVWDSEFMFIPGPRAVHTLSLRLNSGTATINRLLVL